MTPRRSATLPLHRVGTWPPLKLATGLATLPGARSGRFPLDYGVLINIAVMPVGESAVAAFDVGRIIRRGAILSICGQYCLRLGWVGMVVPSGGADAGEGPGVLGWSGCLGLPAHWAGRGFE